MVFSLQILASGSIQIKKNHSECKVTFTVNKYLNLPAHFIGSNILMRHLGSLQDKSVVLCVQYYITYVGFIQTLRIHATITLFFLWSNKPTRSYATSFLSFLYHTQLDTHIHPVVGLPCKGDQLVARVDTYTTHNTHNRRTSMPSEGFEPVIPAIKPLQTFA